MTGVGTGSTNRKRKEQSCLVTAYLVPANRQNHLKTKRTETQRLTFD